MNVRIWPESHHRSVNVLKRRSRHWCIAVCRCTSNSEILVAIVLFWPVLRALTANSSNFATVRFRPAVPQAVYLTLVVLPHFTPWHENSRSMSGALVYVRRPLPLLCYVERRRASSLELFSVVCRRCLSRSERLPHRLNSFRLFPRLADRLLSSLTAPSLFRLPPTAAAHSHFSPSPEFRTLRVSLFQIPNQ